MLGVNEMEDKFIDRMMKISQCINKPMEDTIQAIQLILEHIESIDTRPGWALDRLDWLLHYSAAYGELPMLIVDETETRREGQPPKLIMVLGAASKDPMPVDIVAEYITIFGTGVGIPQHTMVRASRTLNRFKPILQNFGNQSRIAAEELSKICQNYGKPFRRDAPKIGRNSVCPCKSGKKYKNCCLNASNVKQ